MTGLTIHQRNSHQCHSAPTNPPVVRYMPSGRPVSSRNIDLYLFNPYSIYPWRTHLRRVNPKIIDLNALSIVTVLLLFIALMLAPNPVRAESLQPEPDQRHTPEDVIQIVLEALRTNNADDQGIETVFRFASPANKRQTGPLDNFTQMIKRGFPDMLNFVKSETEPVQIRDRVAIQPVWLTTLSGREVGYLFRLGKQTDGEYINSWMTDAVLPLPPRGQSI